MLKQLWNDETGFIVSAELILIATLLVIGLIVGMSEVQHAVVEELGDVGEAIGSLNQSYLFTGFQSFKHEGGLKAFTVGSRFRDRQDDCDGNECDLSCGPIVPENPKCDM
jgi:Flp pilus assembly pilin Flp